MAETYYPQRQRCKGCGKAFPPSGAIRLQFCSYPCAGMPYPPQKPTEAPRECVTTKEGALAWKRRWKWEGEIPEKIKGDPSVSTYLCGSCGFTHIGHSRKLEVEETRVVRSRKELAEVLVKSRGRASLKEVAAVAKIRPIRLKELEDPSSEKVDLDALFAVLALYKVKLAVVFR